MRTAIQERQFYNAWDTYEKDLHEEGWQIPHLLVQSIRPFLRGGETILDVGCGTGFIGAELRKIGWHGILFGVDIAELRLAEAAKKSIYKSCLRMNANHLQFPGRFFNIVLSGAVVGLTGPKSVKEMYRVVKAGGLVACAAGEIKDMFGGSERFKSSIRCMRRLSNAQQILRKDLGTGYRGGRDDEHYILFIFRRLAASSCLSVRKK